jgi:hypothetical protein
MDKTKQKEDPAVGTQGTDNRRATSYLGLIKEQRNAFASQGLACKERWVFYVIVPSCGAHETGGN